MVSANPREIRRRLSLRLGAQTGAHQLKTNWMMVYGVQDGLIRSMRNLPGDQHAVDDFFRKASRPRPLAERLEI